MTTAEAKELKTGDRIQWFYNPTIYDMPGEPVIDFGTVDYRSGNAVGIRWDDGQRVIKATFATDYWACVRIVSGSQT